MLLTPFSSVPRLLLATLLLVLLASVGPTPARADLFQLQMSRYFSVLTGVEANAYASPSTANAACAQFGGSLIADYNTEAALAFVHLCVSSGIGGLCTSFIDGSAQPDSANLLGCVERVPVEVSATAPNSRNCYYRWRYGLFDSVAYEDAVALPGYFLPGTAYYRYLYRFADGTSQVLNGYAFSPWNTSTALYTGGYPRGYFSTMGGVHAASRSYVRMDGPVPAVHNNPNPLHSFYVTCSVQLSFIPDRPTTTRMPQPVVVMKVEPWAQRYWWVIFLIIAVVILFALGIVILCRECRLLANRREVDPVENSLVLRERKGSAYISVEGSDDDADTGGSRDTDEGDNGSRRAAPQTRQPPRQQPLVTAPPHGQSLMDNEDPTDYIRVLPRIYSQSDVSLTSDGAAFSEDQYNDSDDSDDDVDAAGEEGDDRRVIRRVRSTRSMDAREAGNHEGA